MAKINQERFQEILETHKLWVESRGQRGCRAAFSEIDLPWANLPGADLTDVILYKANLRRVNLHGANLTGVYFSYSDLRGANLSEANLTGAYLTGTYLYNADLRVATAKGCCIYKARLFPKDKARLLMLGARE